MGAYLAHRRDPFVRMWLDGPFAKVAVGVDTEEELLALHDAALKFGIPCRLITDAGRTEFNGVPTKTALAIGPGDPDKIHALTGHLKLR
jgi:PTH2 family peptidyl-tRNA hydrolase